MNKPEIVQLVSKNAYFDVICEWMYNWWGKEEGWSYDKVSDYLEHSFNKDTLPNTYIALIDNKIVGVYQLSMSDLDVRPNLYPWLINVYVDPSYRGGGISKLLINHSIEKARELKFKSLYLYTRHNGLYEKYGFNLKEEAKTYITSDDIERIYEYKIDNE